MSEPGIRLLDFGCGDGATAKYFTKYFPDGFYQGIDISGESIKQACEQDRNRCLFTHFDAQTIPFDNESFDVIMVANVFHHIEKKKHIQILSEISRVLAIN